MFSMRSLIQATAITGTVLLIGAGSANAALIDFFRITDNGNTNVAGQLHVDVTSFDSNTIQFRFTNAVGIASSVTDIYFDTAGSFSSNLGSFESGVAVGSNFSLGASPPDLPGGNGVSFTANFAVDSDPPVAPNGINASGDRVDLRFTLAAGVTFQEVLDDIADGDLRLGLHVQAIGTQGGSDSYVSCYDDNCGTPPGESVPEPMTLGLLGAGLIGMGWVARRRRVAR